jgi:hypothetical protein
LPKYLHVGLFPNSWQRTERTEEEEEEEEEEIM